MLAFRLLNTTAAFGPHIRIRIRDHGEAERLLRRLNDIWAEEAVTVAVDLQTLLAATTTKQATLTTTAKEYVEVRGIQERPTISIALLLAQDRRPEKRQGCLAKSSKPTASTTTKGEDRAPSGPVQKKERTSGRE